VSTLQLKKRELERRIASLPTEVAEWRTKTLDQLDKNAHSTQLAAIEVLVRTLTDPQSAAVAALDPTNPTRFKTDAFAIVQSIIKAQKCWDFFRAKLNLREVKDYSKALWTADTIAWNCHRPIMDKAIQWHIVDKDHVREPPLVYCTAEYSPATWVRKSRPNDGRQYNLGGALLPIPVIEIPWDHLSNSWDYLSLHHEVGHDIEADLGVRAELQTQLQQALAAAGVPAKRIGTWVKWQGEVFADLCGLRLAGPTFADTLMHLLILPHPQVTTFDADDPHPTAYPRILLNAAYIRRLGTSQAIQDHAARIEQEWQALYGASSGDPALDAFTADFSLVCDALMHRPLNVLSGRTMAEFIPYTDGDDARIRQAVTYFKTGMATPNNLDIRFVPSAARLAINSLQNESALTDTASSKVHERVLDYVRQNAPPGMRGGVSGPHEKFVASFAAGMFES
jgi:hypothetical protein